jgi:putative SOS response-associated peptidase YedK
MCGKFTQMMSWGAYVSLADLLAGESPSGDMRSEVVSPMRDAFVVRLSAGGARETADALRPGAVVGNRSRHGHALHSCPRRDHRRHQSLLRCPLPPRAHHRVGFFRIAAYHADEMRSAPHLAGRWQACGARLHLGTLAAAARRAIRTFAIVTVPANALIAAVHDRMSAIIAEADWPKWLGETPATAEELKALLRLWEAPMHIGPVRSQKPAPPPPRPLVQSDLF